MAYVFVRASAGKSKNMTDALAKIEGVKSAHAVTGRFDVIARVQAADISAIGELILTRIQPYKE